MRVGFGCDIHPFDANKPLFLGGVFFPSCPGLRAHSDGDVVIHAVCDALLGAAGLGDIGERFPDSDSKYKNIKSVELLNETAAVIHNAGYVIENIDIMVLAEKPKINPEKKNMSMVISRACGIDLNQVNLKATTAEKLGFVGREEGITAYAVALLKSRRVAYE
ncbi:2-C-methyl-D-erythritol 2,4-cyclodiphosphate synthase [bacterium]|nr:2-C-methyl-D-erythritol 2,4-cyclodiphosphate synthase [bacterium]MCP5463155.1 2-C-methyl-D-erythritol 2,4-cyclodiphosphate synthase [bacterium]